MMRDASIDIAPASSAILFVRENIKKNLLLALASINNMPPAGNDSFFFPMLAKSTEVN
jgi:hypothetical protein